MRFIPTSAEKVEELKKRAKRLQRSKSGKHADWLERVAKDAGYNHWHHVVQCERMTRSDSILSLVSACTRATEAAKNGKATFALTGPDGAEIKPWLVFSTSERDACDLPPALAAVWFGVRGLNRSRWLLRHVASMLAT